VSAGKILVVRGGAIGDFILTLPVFAALREQFPTARLEVLGYSHIASLAKAGGLVDDVRSIEARALAGFFAKDGTLDTSLQEFFGSFAVILSYLYDPDGIFQANVARCSKAQFIAGPHRPNDRAPIHATEVMLKPLERLAIFAPDSTPKLKIANSLIPHSVLHTPHLTRLAIHPGSGSEQKNWPEQKWAEAMRKWLSLPGISLLLVGGEAEQGRLERLATQLGPARVELAANLPLVELALRLSSCRAFAGHDSGISHLAAALGLPVVVLWGDTSETVWRPKGPNVILLKDKRGLPELAVDQVVEAVLDLLNAPPSRGE